MTRWTPERLNSANTPCRYWSSRMPSTRTRATWSMTRGGVLSMLRSGSDMAIPPGGPARSVASGSAEEVPQDRDVLVGVEQLKLLGRLLAEGGVGELVGQ